ncbi:MAG TPA: universal stress protein [Burkholderiales bacterium]|nr:universal stress protein [Burkholderiales bacterium]
MYTHILMPYDGSPLSDRALSEGIAFAKDADSKITLLHVMGPYHVPGSRAYVSPELKEIERQHLEELKKNVSEMLAKAQQRATAAGVKCDCVVRDGLSPYQEIIAAAKDLGCDLIMMASHGRRGFDGLVLGSETIKVLTHCTIPVLVVR